MTTKICCTCKKEKPVDCFSHNKRSKDGFKEYCKECAAIKTAKYRELHKDKINEAARISYQKSKARAEERTRKEMMSPSRVCTVCGIEKPLSEFYKRGNGGFYSQCKKCSNEKSRQYALENHDNVIARKRQYHKDHKAEIDAYNHEYYKAKADNIKERVKKWELENPEADKDNQVLYFHRARSKKAGIKSDYTRGQWRYCKEYFSIDGAVHCAYCGKPLKRATQDHVIPFEKGGENTALNILPVCLPCNSSKAANELKEWYRKQQFYSVEREKKIEAYFESLKHANTERAT